MFIFKYTLSLVYSLLSFIETYKKAIFWTFKFLIIVFLGILIFDRIVAYDRTGDIVSNFTLKLETKGNWPFLVVCLILMFVNWGLETSKWKYLTKDFFEMGFFKASEGILLGISLGIITPSRVGEYGGRVINLPAHLRSSGLKAHFLSSLSQNIVNIIIGSLGAFVYFSQFTDVSLTLITAIVSISLFFSMLLVAIYFGNNSLIEFIQSKIPDRISKKIFFDFKTTRDFNDLSTVLIISCLRYIIFVSQYVLLLYFFGIGIPLLAMVTGISLIYLIQSGVPLPPFLSMLARGEIAIVIWSFFSVSVLSILSATFTLWILNLLIPALVGASILVRKDLG